MSVLVVVEHDRGTLAPATLETLTAARGYGQALAFAQGAIADPAAPRLFAALTGTRKGGDVAFTKRYDGVGGATSFTAGATWRSRSFSVRSIGYCSNS